MALHIDTNNVTLMSELKSAIEDYVEKAIDNKLEIAIKESMGMKIYNNLQLDLAIKLVITQMK